MAAFPNNSSPITLPPLSSFDFPSVCKPTATTGASFSPFNIPASRRWSQNSSCDNLSSASSSVSGFSPDTPSSTFPLSDSLESSLVQLNFAPSRPFELPESEADRRASDVLPDSTANPYFAQKPRTSWSPHGSEPFFFAPPSRQRRASGLRTTFTENDGKAEVDAFLAESLPSLDDGWEDVRSLNASRMDRQRSWSYESEDADEMDVDLSPSSQPREMDRRESFSVRPAFLSHSVVAPRASKSASHSRNSSYELGNLFQSSSLSSSALPVAPHHQHQQLASADRRPSLDRRTHSEATVFSISNGPVAPRTPPMTPSVFASPFPQAATPPQNERNHPYRRTTSVSISPTSGPVVTPRSSNQLAAPQVSEIGKDGRRAFSRSSKACESCKSRKTKCTSGEGNATCIRCNEMDLPCVWTESNKKRGPSANARPKHSRSASAITPIQTEQPLSYPLEHSPCLVSGWTSTVPAQGPTTPTGLSTQRPPLTFERTRPKSEHFGSTFTIPASHSNDWSSSIAGPPPRATHGQTTSGHHRPLSFQFPPAQAAVGLGLTSAGQDDNLVFVGDNTLTLPPLRVAIRGSPFYPS